jgi:hypothetical protein
MKNIKNYKLKKCIYMSVNDFSDLIYKITDGLTQIEYENGIYLTHSKKAKEKDEYWNEDIKNTLSKYFDIEIISYHVDFMDSVGVWICYKD